MGRGNREEHQVGDLFVTEGQLMLKLLPSKRAGAKPIRWFCNGTVTDHRLAVQDIAALVDRLKGRTHSVRGLTVMTHHGLRCDPKKSGLSKAIEKAGYRILN